MAAGRHRSNPAATSDDCGAPAERGSPTLRPDMGFIIDHRRSDSYYQQNDVLIVRLSEIDFGVIEL